MLKSENKTIPLITHPSTKALSRFTGLPTIPGALDVPLMESKVKCLMALRLDYILRR